VKENAPGLLHRAPSRLHVDIVGTSDYQPAEKLGLSRGMLEVCPEMRFPVPVLAPVRHCGIYIS
jgi:hypothetical protein